MVVSTLVIYLVQNSQLRLLPRDFDSPASLLAAVHASEKLKAWAERHNERRKLLRDSHLVDDDDVTVKMGYFTGADGEQHWGIEVVDPPKEVIPEDDSQIGAEERMPMI